MLVVLKKFLPYLLPQQLHLRRRTLLALIFLVLAKLTSIVTPYLSKQLIDAFDTSEMPHSAMLPLGLILAYNGARLMVSLFEQLREIMFARVAQIAVHHIALDVFQHLHSLSLRFHLERQMGGLTRIIERGSKAIQEILRFMLLNILPTILEVFLVTIFLWFYLSFIYALVILLTVAIYIIFTLSVTEWRIKFRREMNFQDEAANTKAIDSLINYETVKYFNNEYHEYHRFDIAMQRYENAAVKSLYSLSIVNFGQATIISIGMLIISLIAGKEIIAATMTIGDFVMLNWFLIQLYMPLNFLGWVYHTLKQATTDMQSVYDILQIQPEIIEKEKKLILSNKKPIQIKFINTEFYYMFNTPILKGVNFVVNPGETVAIVGPSGAGKSTIARILFRFYDYSKGQVLINNIAIENYSIDSLRSNIAIVPQDTILFHDTIFYNIAYGSLNATRDEVIEAAKQAHVYDFISRLPEGFNTIVGERGLKLSGGEKQRVVIARTILKNPGILLLDEATSSLDTTTERQIQYTLDKISAGRTVITIAHRLSTVVNADRIVVLDQGTVAESGTHDELLFKRGLYSQMWQSQITRREYNTI